MRTTLANIFRHLFLLGQLIRSDCIGRYRTTFLGLFWIILNPLILFFLYVFIFSVVLHVRFPEKEGVYFYGLNLFCGLIAWNAFADSFIRSSSAILNNAHLVKRTFFPSEILGLSITASSMVRFLVELIFFIALLPLLGYKITWAFCWLPLIVLLQFIFCISLAWFASALTVFLRDLTQFIGPLLTAWFFMTPVVYPETMVDHISGWSMLATLVNINPMSKFISTYRGILLFGYLDLTANLAWLALFVLVLFFASAWFFGRVKYELVENL